MRYFLSTGEASGELTATLLAQAIRAIDSKATFAGIGSTRMREAGVSLWRDHAGWASMGPLAAIPRVPKLLATMYLTAAHLAREKPDLVILVDFGAFNVRLAKRLRRIGYTGPVLDVFPPATWLDREKTAREIVRVATPLTAFAHQRDFYRSLHLPIQYFGHPLVAQYAARAPRPPAPSDGGTIALLPGSRSGELRLHVPAVLEAFALLKHRRPGLQGVVGAVDERAEQMIRTHAHRLRLSTLRFERGLRGTVQSADAAWVASGTAVLECALLGIPAVAFYIVSRALVRHARRVYAGRFITLPNLVLGREVVPELLQEKATAQNLASLMDGLLANPAPQYDAFTSLREALGPADALERCAAFAVHLARGAPP